jgi:uncharacterized protein YifN (PemK superfamily)
MITDVVEAGTVVHLDFNHLGGAWPEMEDEHPAVVLTPASRQNGGTIIVVPLSSKLANADNPNAVEITHKALAAASPTGRTFAICNLPVALALSRPGLEIYRGKRAMTGNRHQFYQIGGDDLKMIRGVVMKQFWDNREFRRLLEHSRLFELLQERHAKIQRKTSQRKARKPSPKATVTTALGEGRSLLRKRELGGTRIQRSSGPKPMAPRPANRDGSKPS